MVATGVALGGETGRNRRTKTPEVKKQADRNLRRQKRQIPMSRFKNSVFSVLFMFTKTCLTYSSG